MRKTIFLICCLFALVSCGSTSQVSSTSSENKPLAKKDQECNILKTSSGDFIYTEKDANTQFGGTWKNTGLDQDLKNTTEACIYTIESEPVDESPPDFITIQIPFGPSYKVTMKTYLGEMPNDSGQKFKEMPSLGNGALLTSYFDDFSHAMLYIKKGDKVIAIEWNGEYFEDKYMKVAQTVLGRI